MSIKDRAAKKVFLTGALGNVGANALVHLCDKDYEVYAFDVKNPRNQTWSTKLAKNYRFTSIWGDLRSQESIAEAISQVGPDAILHLAAVIAPTAYVMPEVAYDVNVMGMGNLLAAVKSLKMKPHFVFASSYSVHGPRNPYRNPSPITSETSINPADNYGRHKVEGEQMIQSSDLPWTIVRLPTVLATAKGWGQSPEFFKIAFLLPLDRRSHVIDSRDAGLALANTVLNERTYGRIFIIGGPEENCRITGRDFFRSIGDVRGIPFPESAFRLADPDLDDSWYYEDWVDTSESQEILIYQSHSFADYLQLIRQQTKYSRPLLRLARPLIFRQVVKQSPFYGKSPEISSESFWSVICNAFDLDPNQR
jgi:nucleoside-diphosphate-sugar epimerase